jgi:hypothetical protein
MQRLRLTVLTILSSALGAMTANASIIVSLGTLDAAPAIVIDATGAAFTLTGSIVAQPVVGVTFSSTERLIAIGDGEAGLTGADGVLTNVTVAMNGGAMFRSLALKSAGRRRSTARYCDD